MTQLSRVTNSHRAKYEIFQSSSRESKKCLQRGTCCPTLTLAQATSNPFVPGTGQASSAISMGSDQVSMNPTLWSFFFFQGLPQPFTTPLHL